MSSTACPHKCINCGKEFNSERNTLIEHWLSGNLSDNTMRETLGLFHYDGVDYPKSKRSQSL